MSKRKAILILLGTFIGATLVVFLVLARLNWGDYYYLWRYGRPGEALVTAKEPENHFIFRYSFSVNGSTFYGFENAPKTLNLIQVGQSITVYYYPADPDVNSYCDPQARLASETTAIGLASILTSAVLSIAIFKRLRPR